MQWLILLFKGTYLKHCVILSLPCLFYQMMFIISGYNWTPQKYILDDGSTLYDGINLGVILVDDITASIFIFYGICSHYDECNTSSLLYVKSTDDGVTWQKPVNVSKQIGTKVFAPGPGYGIQVRWRDTHQIYWCTHGWTKVSENGVFFGFRMRNEHFTFRGLK